MQRALHRVGWIFNLPVEQCMQAQAKLSEVANVLSALSTDLA